MLPEPPESPAESTTDPTRRGQISRARAAAEVLICSGYPTQLLIIAVFGTMGVSPTVNGALSPTFIFTISAIDTVLLLGLVFWFLRMSDERPRDVFFGHRRIAQELGIGIALLPVIFMIVLAVQLSVRAFAPHLHNVEESPFAPMLSSPALLGGFVILVLVAGGVREELQRAFLLHRFEQRLGGGSVGIAISSIAFGLGHTVQGWDAAIATALMGAFWGAVYLTRRSVLSTVTNHALFNFAQVALGYATLARS